MQTYKVEYYTLCKGRNATGPTGNLKQHSDIAYIQCADTSKLKGLLDEHFSVPQPTGLFYVPVIETITAIKGHCIHDKETSNQGPEPARQGVGPADSDKE